MKFHGIQLQEGSAVKNLTADSGATFPVEPNIGELFFLSAEDLNVNGLYVYITGDWRRIGAPMTGLAGQQMATVISAATTTSVIPFDNSAPLSTEGALLTSITITPTSANSTFMGVIAVTVDTGNNTRTVTITIFRGTTLVGMGVTNNTTSGRPQSLSVTFFDAPATTSDVTYNVRIGQNLSGTTYINTTSNASFGNAAKSAFIVSETL